MKRQNEILMRRNKSGERRNDSWEPLSLSGMLLNDLGELLSLSGVLLNYSGKPRNEKVERRVINSEYKNKINGELFFADGN